MKKSLVLAMAMALGVTASAYAANPFSDVPAGVIEGYGDSTFGGDKLMTRYEMAQIVAKAMAKGANVDKLAAEFADELDNLGVRVANLEKKADNVKVTGELRYKYMSKKDDANDGQSFENDLRSRIWVTGQINDDWSYTGMIENTQDFYGESANKGDEDPSFARAYVEGKIGGLNVTAGRYNAFLANGNIYDDKVDGAEVSYGDKVKVTGFAGKATEVDGGNYAGGELAGAFGDLNLAAGYVNYKDLNKDDIGKGLDNAIWYVGADYTMGDVNLSGMYLKGDMSYNDVDKKVLDDDGWTVGLAYKGAEATEAGSWGLFANYYDLGGQTYIAHTTDANTFDGVGFKGYGVGANYTFAKNIVGTVAYYDTENKLNSKVDDQRVWADLTFTF